MTELGTISFGLLIIFAAVGGAAVLTWFERRLLGVWQDRYGPNRLGPFGVLQVAADMLKLLTKHDWVPPFADRLVFVFAPTAIVVAMLLGFAVVPFGPDLYVLDINIGLLFFLGMTSLAVYSVLLGGLASNNKYALLGGLRSAAQMVSYEVSIGFVIITVLLCAGSLNLTEFVMSQSTGLGTMIGLPGSFLDWYWLPLFPLFIVYFISGVAETNRAPFDVAEGESEIVAGFHVEYSGMNFAVFFLAEYANMILMSGMTVTLFLGGWLPIIDIAPFNWIPGVFWFAAKTAFILFCFLWVRATFPRYRYDQLMRIGWKVFLPLSLAWVVVIAFLAKFEVLGAFWARYTMGG